MAMTASFLPRPQLRCSVIIAVHNGAATLTRCLDGLARQTVAPGDFEIVVVDDGCTDDTAALAEAWRDGHQQFALQIVRHPCAGLAAARNYGAQVAQTPLLLFADADCAPAPQWVETFVDAFGDDRVVGAKGTFRTEQAGLVPRFVQAEYEDRYDRMRRLDQIDFIDNYSAAYRRDVFLANGGFDAHFAACDDQEFSFRLAEKGYRMIFVPAAVVTHLHDTSLAEYMHRKFAQGFWKAPLTRLHPERMVQDAHTPQVLKLQIVVASVIVALLPLALLGSVVPILEWLWAVEIALVAVFLASASPFLAKLGGRSWSLALFGAGMVAVRALALGSGYLAGTIHFAGAPPGARQPVIPGCKRFVTRGIDIFGALLGLAVAIPLVAVAAIAIKLDSPGPIFYWQVRIGENGRPFRIAKLRSMVVDAEARLDALVDLTKLAEEPAFKLADDPRVTRVGRFLRRTSLDEMPQFYNVLRGDMSLVGPRPEEERIVRLYTDHHRKRLAVKPGITGPMQVSGRGDLAFSDRLQLELDYIENYSLSRDLSILLRTVPVLMHGKGAR
jgi:lipopolysaccharide/colanic/teichoic acid biosynthesis glycosyltransferase/glycosyltransferase involved in cell wall biosynthesis